MIGRLFSFGYGQSLSIILSGTYKDIPISLADYQYDTGERKDRETHYYTLGELTVNGTLPSILCVPVKWNFLDTWKPDGFEKLSLEGTFTDEFVVYVQQGKEIESLQILEPDTMAKLMDGFENFGFECSGSNMYIFTPGSMAENKATVVQMYSQLQTFCADFLPELQTFTQGK
jgi:hypothetical protein